VPTNHNSHQLERISGVQILRLCSEDGTNRLTRTSVLSLTETIRTLARQSLPLVITGNPKFFSVGADLNEIAALTGPAAYEFSKLGQILMSAIEHFPAPVYAAVEGHCMGGGLDLALACHRRVAAPHAVFGHRGAALGLMTGWGGTQRLARLVGKAKALEIFVTAEKIRAGEALHFGLVNAVAEDPVQEAVRRIQLHADGTVAVVGDKPVQQ
jgi:enoyl-CoA hydratase/carnithine racemase